MSELANKARARLAGEGGFTLIELLMAAMVAAVALVALVGTFDFSRESISGAEKMETAVHVGEQELERITSSTDYESIGLTSTPAHQTDPSDPRYYVVGSNYQWDSTNTSHVEPLVTTEGTLSPSASWNDASSRLQGQIWRFVTWVYDPNVVQTPDEPEAKRVTVAVTVNGAKRPVVLNSVIYNRRDPS